MSLVYILYVRGNSGYMNDTEYYVEHVVFAVLLKHLLYYRSTPHHDAVHELRHDGTVIEK